MASKYSESTTGDEVARDLGSEIRGKIILVTGVSPGGLGAKFCEIVAKGQPATIILAGRNASKTKETAKAVAAANSEVKTKILEVDLSSLASVRQAAKQVNSWDDVPRIDVLVNNAGIMAVEFGLTEDGFERHFGTNHLGPFLFSNLILKKILASASPRIVVVSSDGHRLSPIRWSDQNFDKLDFYNKWAAYGQSKTANNLFTVALAEKLGLKGLQAYSLHPGVIMTNLGAHLDWSGPDTESLHAQDVVVGSVRELKIKSPEQGVATHVYVAFAPDIAAHNGAYFQDCRVADPFRNEVWSWGASKVDAERLWQLSEKLVGQEFRY